MCVSAQAHRGVWIGFYHDQVLVPQDWLSAHASADRSEADCNEALAQPFPGAWQSLEQPAIFAVGKHQQLPVFVVQLCAASPAQKDNPPMPAGYAVGHLRAFLGSAPSAVFAVLSRGAQLLRWHRDYQFCPRCGTAFTLPAKMLDLHQDMVKHCAHCEQGQYPRISPCVLVLVTDDKPPADAQILLARGRRHRPGFWSTLAGFIEPGESAEAAVAREVFEEVGLVVSDIVYRGSQAWPFPHALMLGFWAKAQSTVLSIDPQEIVEAKWLSGEQLRRGGMPDGHFLPPQGALSRQLIDDYLALSL